MKVIVTCGPGCELIDQVRFISNFSTGELGSLLASALQDYGFEPICLRSRLATYPMEKNVPVIPFSTNEELVKIFEEFSVKENIRAVLHAAALCDYRVQKVTAADGSLLHSGKIPTNMGTLNLILEPSLKVISKLRTWFPEACLIGWKYEVSGTREEACAKAQQQISKYQLDASIANGPAVENAFEFLSTTQARQSLDSKRALVQFLAKWLQDIL